MQTAEPSPAAEAHHELKGRSLLLISSAHPTKRFIYQRLKALGVRIVLKCGGEMKLAALVLDDGELSRILAHQGWSVNFPKTKPARAPPA